jgi:hypothetical protein
VDQARREVGIGALIAIETLDLQTKIAQRIFDFHCNAFHARSTSVAIRHLFRSSKPVVFLTVHTVAGRSLAA